MAIIWLPEPTHNNLNATGVRLSPARLKCATIPQRIKESSKVPAKVRLFRLLPRIIIRSFSPTFNCCYRRNNSFETLLQRPFGDDKDNKTVIFISVARLQIEQPRLQGPAGAKFAIDGGIDDIVGKFTPLFKTCPDIVRNNSSNDSATINNVYRRGPLHNWKGFK